MNVSIKKLVPRYTRESDPNKMTDEEFTALCQLMKEVGCVQSLTVAPDLGDGNHEIIDGHHRFWAAQQVGLKTLPVEVATVDDERAKALGLGLNKIRGNPDLQIATEILRELDGDLGREEMALLTGYAPDEINDLLATTTAADMGDADQTGDLEDGAADALPAPFVLEISFRDKATYQKARRLLRKAAGETKDLAIGLLNALGEIP